MEITPTAANWRVYADLLHEQATLARVQDLARELADAYTLEECRGQISKLGDLMATGKGVDAWSMADAYRWFMASQASDKKPEYISSTRTPETSTPSPARRTWPPTSNCAA